MKLSERIDEWLIIRDSRRGERYIERYNKKLQKLLNKGLRIYQTTIWAFVRAEMKYDNCATLKAIIENADGSKKYSLTSE